MWHHYYCDIMIIIISFYHITFIISVCSTELQEQNKTVKRHYGKWYERLHSKVLTCCGVVMVILLMMSSGVCCYSIRSSWCWMFPYALRWVSSCEIMQFFCVICIELAQFSGYDQLSWQHVDNSHFSNVSFVFIGHYGNSAVLLGEWSAVRGNIGTRTKH